jgi:Ser-tRNA(Ala) deacylase AlaX
VPRFHRTVEIEDVDVVRETTKAILVEFADRSIWVPRSQLHLDSVRHAGDHGTLIVSEWFAQQADLEAHAAAQVTVSALPTATRVFRRLAQEHHPDHGGRAETMKALSELWSAVRDDMRAIATNGSQR